MNLCNYEATCVENGRLALEELRKPENDFDLLLLDLVMPEMDGFELLTIMKSDKYLIDIPVIVMSANESKQVVCQSLSKDYFELIECRTGSY